MHPTEKLFSENAELFCNLFHYMYEPLAICEIIFDKNGEPYDYRHLEVNSAFEIFTGIPARVLLGKTRREFGEPDPYSLDLFGQVVKTGEPGAREVYDSGSGKWCDLRAISLGGGKFAFIFMDITKNKLADGALRESETKYRTLFETMDEGFALCELVRDGLGKVIDYRVLEANRAFEKYTGFAPTHVVGRLRSEVNPVRDGHLLELRARAVETGESIHLEHFLEGLDLWVSEGIFPRGGDQFAELFDDITERKKNEQMIRESEERYRAFFENSIDAILITTPDGGIEAANEAACQMFQMTEEEIIKSGSEEVIDASDPRLEYALEERKRTGRFRGELNLKRKDGTVFPVDEANVVFKDRNGKLKTIMILRDMTIRKQIEERALASEREMLKVTMDSLKEGVVAVDPDSKIIFINKTAAQILGFCQNEVIGQPLESVFYVFEDKTSESIKITDTQAVPKNPIVVTRDLREIPISLSCSPITTKDGQVSGTIAVFQDISEKQKTEQELYKADKLESLGILAGGIAHDFNNILAAILSNIQLALVKYQKDEDHRKYLLQTIEITRKASELTKQLLTFSRGGAPVKKDASLTDLIQDTAKFVLRGSNIKAEFLIQNDLWGAYIDEGQISQVIHNLVLNAKQAMPKGGIVTITAENLVIEDYSDFSPGNYIKITVRDQGVGIPKENLSKIFDPFFTTKQEGNGLGLATSYSIIKQHDGYIEVESQEQRGTSFRIYLPALNSMVKQTAVLNEVAASGANIKILLMDDEVQILNAVGEMLKCYGYRIELASDGSQVIEIYKKAKNNGEPFDVVIMDLTIPGGMGGQETIAHLRDIDSDIIAIVSSGYANDPIVADYERFGFKGVVTKPYKFDELNGVLNKVVKRKQLELKFDI